MPKYGILFHISADGSDLHPIHFGEQRLRQFGPEQGRKGLGRESVGKSVPAGDRFAQTKRIELSQRLSQQARRGARL